MFKKFDNRGIERISSLQDEFPGHKLLVEVKPDELFVDGRLLAIADYDNIDELKQIHKYSQELMEKGLSTCLCSPDDGIGILSLVDFSNVYKEVL